MIRRALASFLRENGWDAVIMEDHERLADETHSQHFRRIVSAMSTSYFVYWPYGAKRAGLDVELGFILDELMKDENTDVRLFVESEAGRIVFAADEHGHPASYFVSKEKGRRTTYYEDLIKMGAVMVEWKGYDELLSALYQHAVSATTTTH